MSFFSQIEAHKSPLYKIKFLITSRPYEDLEEKFQLLLGVSTYLRFDGDDKSQRIGQEINLVIDHEIPRIAGGFTDEHRKRISDCLKRMNDRTYLWLFLTIDIIVGSRSKSSKPSSIDSLLSNLPKKVSDAYETILARSSDIDLARILLQLIVAATRPLSLEEANIALTLATQKTCTSHKELDLWLLPHFKSTVRNICGLFISIHDGKISLIYQTARQFLLRTKESPSYPDKWEGCLDIATAHGTISQICLAYLNFDDFAGTLQNHSSQNSYAQREDECYHLLDYAAVNWAAHYSSQPSEFAKNAQKAAQKLCNTSLPQQSYWFKIYCESEHLTFEDWTSLGIASLLGIRYVIETFLNESADVNAQGGDYGNALQAASVRGHNQVVQMLLEKGADVNTQGGLYGNALQAASYGGHDQVVQMLLDKGADVNAQGGHYGNALQMASWEGHDQVVLQYQGKYEAAEEMNRRVLKITPSILEDSESNSCETVSIASSMPSESSKSSASSHATANNTLVAALDEVIAVFMSDEDLQFLFAEAFIKQDQDRVSRNGVQLLKWLGRRLMVAANTPVEKEAAKFFSSRRHDRAIIDKIAQGITTKSSREEAQEKATKQESLEFYLQKQMEAPTLNLESEETLALATETIHDHGKSLVKGLNDVGSDASSDSEQTVLSNVDAVKLFLKSSDAFARFKEEFEDFINPFRSEAMWTKTLWNGGKRVRFEHSSNVPRLTNIDELKLAAERKLGMPILWWPLRQPRKHLPSSKVRIIWICVGHRSCPHLESSTNQILRNVVMKHTQTSLALKHEDIVRCATQAL